MKHLKKFMATILATAALSALLGAGTASATTLEVNGIKQTGKVSITATIASGRSLITSDTFNFAINTCNSSQVSMTTDTVTGTTVTGKVSTLTFSGCQSSVAVHTGGTLHVAHIAGTTNGTVSSSGAEVTTDGPFGILNCKTGTGTHLGTLTGSGSGHASLSINAVISCSGLSSSWMGTYTVTSPTGLGVVA